MNHFYPFMSNIEVPIEDIISDSGTLTIWQRMGKQKALKRN